jgi:DNA repair protein RadC
MENIKHLLPVDRPREKLQIQGPQALSDAELLAIVFGSGNRGLPVSQVCDELLNAIQLKDIPDAEVKTLCQTKGIGPAKALVLLAIVEISRRLYVPPLLRLPDHEAVAAHLRPILEAGDGLSYLLVLLTADRELLAICELGSVLPDLNRTVRLATEAGAKRIQLACNGWLQFSRLEYQFQRNLELACGALGIVAYESLAINGEKFKLL